MSRSLEIVVICSECGEELDSEVTMEDWKSTVRVEVKPCACQQIEDDGDDARLSPAWWATKECSPELIDDFSDTLRGGKTNDKE